MVAMAERVTMTRAARLVVSPLLVGPVIGALSTPSWGYLRVDEPGLDESAWAGIHMGFVKGLSFGPDITYTHGPLGFLNNLAPYFWRTGFASALFVLVIQVALSTTVFAVLRRSFGSWLAAGVTFVVARAALRLEVGAIETFMLFLVFLWCVAILRGDVPVRLGRWLVPAGGLLCGLLLLLKTNAAVPVIGVCAVAVWFLEPRGWRSALRFAGSLAVAVPVLWLLTGGGVGDIPRYLSQSLEILKGYAEAVGIEEPGRRDEYIWLVVVLGALGFLAVTGTRGWPRDRRVGLAVAGLLVLFAAFKHTFVRHGFLHSSFFFIGALIAGVAFTWKRDQLLKVAAGLAVLMVAVLHVTRVGAGQLLNPKPTLRSEAIQWRMLVVPARFDREVDRIRSALRSAYALDEQTLQLLAGRTVHIDPREAGVAWAYPEMNWRPVPTFQSFLAYTSTLDKRNAEFIQSTRAPERILRQHVARYTDGHNQDFESPAATLAMACNYSEMRVQGQWQVLDRSGNRCGPATKLGSVKARLGEQIRVPEAPEGQLVVARIEGLKSSFYHRVRTLLWKFPTMHIDLDGDARFRIVPGTVQNGLVMRAPGTLGYSQGFGFRDVGTFTVGRGDSRVSSRLSVEFLGIPVRA